MTLEVALMGHKRAGLVVEVPDLVGIFLGLQEHVHRRQVCALLKHGHGPPPMGFVNLLLARAVAEGPCHFVRYNAVMESAVQLRASCSCIKPLSIGSLAERIGL